MNMVKNSNSAKGLLMKISNPLPHFRADSALKNMVNGPKTSRTFWKKCGKHQPHKVPQNKEGQVFSVCRECSVMTGSRAVMVGRLELIFHKMANTTKIVLRLECVSPTTDLRECWLLRDASIFNWEEIGERAKWSSCKLHILFYYEDNKILRICSLKTKQTKTIPCPIHSHF